MAAVNKAATGTDIGLGSSWEGGQIPSSSSVATWISTSLGGGLTGSLTVNGGAGGGVSIVDALTDVSWGNGTLSLGSGGLNISGKNLTLSGTVIPVGPQSWTIGANRTLNFSGSATGTLSNNLTFNGTGTTKWTGTSVWTGASTIAVALQSGIFNLTSGNFDLKGSIFFAIGTSPTDKAIFNLDGGSATWSRTNTTSVEVGRDAGYSLLRVKSGSLTTGIDMWIGAAPGATIAQGNYWQTGGTVSVGSDFAISRGNTSGTGASRNAAYISGGTFTASTVIVGTYFHNNSVENVLDISGNATVNATIAAAAAFTVGQYLSGIATISGNATVNANTSLSGTYLRYISGSASSFGILNLNGGTLNTSYIWDGNTNGTSTINFDGGKWYTNHTTNNTVVLNSTIDSVIIWSGGATIGHTGPSTSSNVYWLSKEFMAPYYSGVQSVPVTSGGSGYSSPPIVSVSYLTVPFPIGMLKNTIPTFVTSIDESTGQVTEVKVTNRGLVYYPSSGYAPTLALVGGGGSGCVLGSPVLTDNATTSGTLTYDGTGRMFFDANSDTSTFNGPIVFTKSGEFGSLTGVFGNTLPYSLPYVSSVNFGTTNGRFVIGYSGSVVSGTFNVINTSFAGQGSVNIWKNNYVGTLNTLTLGSVGNLTGTTDPTAGVTGTGARFKANTGSGVWTVSTDYVAGGSTDQDLRFSNVRLIDLPNNGQIGYYFCANSVNTLTNEIIYAGPENATYNTGVKIFAGSGITLDTSAQLTAERSFTITGPVKVISNGTVPPSVVLSPNDNKTLTMAGDIDNVTTSYSLAISQSRYGKVVLSGNNRIDSLSVSFGTLSLQSANSLGQGTESGSLTMGSVGSDTGSTLEIGPYNIYKPLCSLVMRGANTISVATGNPVVTLLNVMNYVGNFATLMVLNVASGASLNITSTGGLGGAYYTLQGGGEFINNTDANVAEYYCFSEQLSVWNGTWTASVITNGGINSHLGKSSNAAGNLSLGYTTTPYSPGFVKYTGAATSTDRNFTLNIGGGGLEATGNTGAITWTGSPSCTQNCTFTLKGTSTLLNTFSGVITNSSGKISFVKSGAGTWVIHPKVGGTGASTNNTFTGTSTISEGTVVLVSETEVSQGTNGRVLGTGNVTVSGTVKTVTGTIQYGRMRYGGNVTFNAGSTLTIGD